MDNLLLGLLIHVAKRGRGEERMGAQQLACCVIVYENLTHDLPIIALPFMGRPTFF